MVISVSNAVEKSFEKSYPSFTGENIVIHNAIDIKAFKSSQKKIDKTMLGITADDFVIMSIGSLSDDEFTVRKLKQ